MDIEFPSDFVWGASTAAYQIEGAWNLDGKGESIWDHFTHHSSKVAGGDTGDVACDHYHLYKNDVALMKDLGLDASRFSTAWTRLFPEGRGKVNAAGRDFYDSLVDELLKHNLEPWLCFYHWDLPQALQDKGGWANRDTVHYFSDYAAFMAEHYGDRVQHFVVMNEPNAVALLGHLFGIHAPGKTDLMAYAAATHHLNLATGETLQRLKSEQERWQLGTVLNLQPVHPKTDSEQDAQAAALFDAAANRNYLDPLLKGEYPELTRGMLEAYIQSDDLKIIHQPLDFLGMNLYTRLLVQADPKSLDGMNQADPPDDAERTDMGWEVYPDALYEQLTDLKDNYGNPTVYVTENGAAFPDVLENGQVHDKARMRYLAAHLAALHRALEDGVNVKGYFVWSLLDNFEWAEGYEKRFGTVFVDYATQERYPKDSYYWYQALIENNGFDLPEVL